MTTSRLLALLALPCLAGALTSCGGGSTAATPTTTAAGSPTTAPAGATPTTASGGAGGAGAGSSSDAVSATATVTGKERFDGPVTGRIVCTHSAAGRLELETQGKPQVELQVKGVKDGTTTLVDAYKVLTGSASYPAGGPQVEGARFQIDTKGTSYLATGGTLTTADGGGTGSIDADAAVPGQPTVNIHYKVVWKDCPAAT